MGGRRRAGGLSLSDLAALAEAWLAVVAFEAALRLLSPRRCLAWLHRGPPARGRRQADPRRLAWIAGVADRHAPGRPACLRRAAALCWLLRRRGVPSRLRLGVARRRGRLVGHAWVELDDGEAIGLGSGWYAPLRAAGGLGAGLPSRS